MGFEAETETAKDAIPTLPLFSLKSTQQQQQQHYINNSSSNLTSPLHTSASVPFKWEEHPGKPLPCLTLALPSSHIKSLELPPRLLNETTNKLSKTPSPTTVLEGPYNYNYYSSSAVGKSSSFRFFRKRQGSFDGTGTLSLGGGSRGSSPERGLLGTIVLSRSGSSKKDHHSNKGLFASWKKRSGIKNNFSCSKSDVGADEGSFVFPSFVGDDDGDSGGATVKVTKMSRKRNLFGLSSSKSHFWATIYGAFKQVIPSPRSSTKWKKDAW